MRISTLPRATRVKIAHGPAYITVALTLRRNVCVTASVSLYIVQVVGKLCHSHCHRLTGRTAVAVMSRRVGDLSGLMSNVNYSWLKGTKCVNWRYI